MRVQIIVVLISLFLSSSVNAQVEILKTNPLSLLSGSINLAYEKSLDDKNSFTGSASYAYRSFGVSSSALGLQAGYRFYSGNNNKIAPEGLFLMPEIGYVY